MIHPIVSAANPATLALLAFAVPAHTATVMDFPDNAALKGKTELQGYAFQRSAPPIGRQCTGQAGSGSVTVTKPVDDMSPQLVQASQGKKGAMVQIDETKVDGTRLAYQFTNATISAIKPATGGEKPMEQISFNYSKVQWITVGCKVTTQPRRNTGGVSSPSSSYGGGYGGRY